MGNETIELSKPYNPSKMTYPATVSLKLDGVPARVSRSKLPQTRQGEDIQSIAHIQNFFVQHFGHCDGVELVGEIYVNGMAFKDISGSVRDTKKQFERAKLYVFDMIALNHPEARHGDRMEALRIVLDDIAGKLGKQLTDLPIIQIKGITVNSPDEADAAHEAFMQSMPDAEGTVLASCMRPWEQGKRKWTLQKNKPEPTIDLEVIGFQEAQTAAGEPLGRVGRIVCKLWRVTPDGLPEPRQIGVGAGKLTHAEAKVLWSSYKDGTWRRDRGKHIAEVKYMRDDSYDSLRQPTFQRWRPDKDQPDTTTEI